MKIGIDSYCYHRFFGEVYPDQSGPPSNMTMDDFIDRAVHLGVDGVSLESCFFPRFDAPWLRDLKDRLDAHGFDRVYAWGHPDGLERGKNRDAFRDMLDHIPRARAIGAPVMRVVGSSFSFRREPHGPQIEALIAWFREAVPVARDHGVKLAVENHIDFTADEILHLLDAVDSEYLGLNFDTGNFLRLLDDPGRGMDLLAGRVYATHVKDLFPDKSVPADAWHFFAGVPVGRGLIDNERLARSLSRAGYRGFLAVEIDHPHSDWIDREDEAVAASVAELRRIARIVSEAS